MRLARRLGISTQVVADTPQKDVGGMNAAATMVQVEQVELADSEFDEDCHMLSGRDSEGGCSTPSTKSAAVRVGAPSTVSRTALPLRMPNVPTF